MSEESEQHPEQAFKIPRLSEAELKKLAIDIDNGNIFSSWSIDQKHDQERLWPLIFLPLIFLPSEAVEEIQAHGGLLYAPMKEALPRCINGFPTFGSVYVLHKDDVPALSELLQRLRQMREEFLS